MAVLNAIAFNDNYDCKEFYSTAQWSIGYKPFFHSLILWFIKLEHLSVKSLFLASLIYTGEAGT